LMGPSPRMRPQTPRRFPPNPMFWPSCANVPIFFHPLCDYSWLYILLIPSFSCFFFDEYINSFFFIYWAIVRLYATQQMPMDVGKGPPRQQYFPPDPPPHTSLFFFLISRGRTLISALRVKVFPSLSPVFSPCRYFLFRCPCGDSSLARFIFPFEHRCCLLFSPVFSCHSKSFCSPPRPTLVFPCLDASSDATRSARRNHGRGEPSFFDQ